MAGPKVLEGADEADGNDRNAELLSDAEAAVLEAVDAAVASTFRLRKND